MKTNKLNTYTATLTGNLRDTAFNPKILLTNIDPNSELDRNHCWVDFTDTIAKIAPQGHSKPIKVSFQAKLKPYIKQGVESKFTLTNIQNIKRIR